VTRIPHEIKHFRSYTARRDLAHALYRSWRGSPELRALGLSHKLFLAVALIVGVVLSLVGWNLLTTRRLTAENRAIIQGALPAVRLEITLLEGVAALRRVEARHASSAIPRTPRSSPSARERSRTTWLSWGRSCPPPRSDRPARAVERRKLSEPIPVRGRDEIAELTIAFNRMAARLRELDTLTQHLFLAITHEPSTSWPGPSC
jgi:HAMP domain